MLQPLVLLGRPPPEEFVDITDIYPVCKMHVTAASAALKYDRKGTTDFING